MRKKMYWIAVLSIFLAVCFWVKHHHQHASPESEAVLVQAATVKEDSIPIETHAVGTLVAAQNINITSETPGQIAEIFFQDGSFVKKGTPLIQLSDDIYKAKYDSANADLTLSETMFHRIEILAKKGIISKQDLEKAAADLIEKKATAQESQVLWEKMLLLAPFDGVVGKCQTSVGDYVTSGQALVTLTDVNHLHVEYALSEKYFGMIRLGQHIALSTSAYPDKTFSGTVAYIAPTVNSQNRTISLYAEVPNIEKKLTAGLFVSVTQSLGAHEKALLIPANSLIATIDGQEVYKIVNNKIEAIAVEIGQRTTTNVQIIKGLALGDTVVVEGMQKVREGEAVKVKS